MRLWRCQKSGESQIVRWDRGGVSWSVIYDPKTPSGTAVASSPSPTSDLMALVGDVRFGFVKDYEEHHRLVDAAIRTHEERGR